MRTLALFCFLGLLCAVLAQESESEPMWVEAVGITGPAVSFVSFNGTNVDRFGKRAYSLSVSPTSGSAGGTFTATYSADDVTSTWIGVFATGTTSTSLFKYVTAKSGSVSFSTSSLAAGTYNVYLVISTGYVRASATYTVSGSSGGTTTGGSTTGGTTTGGGSSDSTAWLNAHNTRRARYGVPNLSWSSNLETSAKNYANQLASGCTFSHSNGNYGENLAMGHSSIEAVLTAWVENEAQYYDAVNKRCSGGVCGHFTQALWRMTSYLGCGTARCSNGRPIYVCQYLRPGNCNGYDYQSTSSPCGPFGP